MLFAHGAGARGELPVPLWLFSWISAVALMGLFVGLGMLWTRPRLERIAAGRPLTAPASGVGQGHGGTGPGGMGALHGAGRALALTLYLVCLGAGLFGADITSDNLLPVTLYVVAWVGAQFVAGAFGDLWGAISPTTTLARGAEAVARRLGRAPVAPPTWLGQWPAAIGLFVFVFYELAHPSGLAPRTLGWMLAVHTLVTLALGARFGSRWVADHEPFNALMAWLGGMGVLFRRDGSMAARYPVSGLARMPVEAGTMAALLVVLGGAVYDGFSASETGQDLLGQPLGWSGALTETIGLVVAIAAVALLYAVGVWWTSRVTAIDRGRAAAAFAPALVPVVFAYVVSHYAQFLVDEIQSFVFRLSDPFGLGWDLFGGSDGVINMTLISPDAVAWVQVLAILFGHLGAVVVAHDRSIELFNASESLRSQFAMVLVVVAYATLGLWLLLAE